MNNNDLLKLGIDVGTYDINLLFNENNAKSPEYCFNRVKCILQIYSSWITLNQQQTYQSHCNIYDLINSSLSPFYNFKTFLQDFKYLMSNPQLLGYDNHPQNHDNTSQQEIAIYQSTVYGNDALLSSNKDELCDASCCYIHERHGRKRAYYTRFSNEANPLFFIDNNDKSSNVSNEDEAITRLISAQQILDSAHSFIFHSMRIDMSLITNNLNTSNNSQDSSELCHDFVATELIKEIRKIKGNSKRFRDADRDENGNISKFVSTNDYKSCFVEEDQVQNKDRNDADSQGKVVCFVDGIFLELVKHGANGFSIAKFAAKILPEEYDTDAFCDDYEDSLRSNVRNYLNESAENEQDYRIMKEICDNYFRIYVNAHEEYSAGFRYFYWKFYQNNQDTANIIFTAPSGQHIFERNDGYRLCDWYIPAAFSTFKEEILNNTTAPFGIRAWQETKDKASIKLETWLECDDARKLIVGDGVPENHKNKWLKVYGIADGVVITVYHIMSLLFYCNFTAQSYEFSATFRKIFWNETEQSLKRRHSYLAQWGRLLRECVDCWGYMMQAADDDPELYFHGIGTQLLFKSTNFKVFGPLSTTTGMFIKKCVLYLFYSDILMGFVLNIRYGSCVW